MTTPYEGGRRMEYQALDDLNVMGYHAQRTAGSHGPFDVIAWNEEEILLIQVKRVSQREEIFGAVHEAVVTWDSYEIPRPEQAVRLAWVRCEGAWYKIPLE